MKHTPLLRLVSALAILALLLSTGAALASSGGPYELSWFNISSGSSRAAGSGYGLFAAAGQPDAGQASGGSYQLEGGFLVSSVSYQNLYLPVLRR